MNKNPKKNFSAGNTAEQTQENILNPIIKTVKSSKFLGITIGQALTDKNIRRNFTQNYQRLPMQSDRYNIYHTR